MTRKRYGAPRVSLDSARDNGILAQCGTSEDTTTSADVASSDPSVVAVT
ncbi:hypothetical protein [Streptomyces umbrinus]